MQWSDEPQAGFSSAEKTVCPVVDKGVWSYKRTNVEAQRRDPNSMLNWTERLIRMRKECPEFGWGTWRALDAGAPGILALRFDWRGNALVAVHNLAAEAREATLTLGDKKGQKLVNLLAYENSEPDGRGTHKIELPPYGYRWFRVGSLNDLQRREPA